MAAKSWFKGPPLKRLQDAPEKFEFVQAIRLLEHAFVYDQQFGFSGLVGTKALPHHEKIRFRSTVSLSFAPTDLAPPQKTNAPLHTTTLHASFFGLLGVSGALPLHFTELALERLRQGDEALNDFLDMFHHRLLSFFYRASLKYHILLEFEKGRQAEHEESLPTQIFQSLHGNGLLAKAKNTSLHFIGVFYAGLLAQRPRSCWGLERILADYYGVPVTCCPFKGTWLVLQQSDRSRLTFQNHAKSHNKLGKGALLGKKVWSIDNKFVLLIGPLSLVQFKQFLPGKKYLPELTEITAYYIPSHLDYVIRLILKGHDVPTCQLRKTDAYQLGWNSWLSQQKPFTDRQDTLIRSKAGSCQR